jgi:hypothetical protein
MPSVPDDIDAFDLVEEAIKRAVARGIIEPVRDEDGNQIWRMGLNGPQKVYRSLIYDGTNEAPQDPEQE